MPGEGEIDGSWGGESADGQELTDFVRILMKSMDFFQTHHPAPDLYKKCVLVMA